MRSKTLLVTLAVCSAILISLTAVAQEKPAKPAKAPKPATCSAASGKACCVKANEVARAVRILSDDTLGAKLLSAATGVTCAKTAAGLVKQIKAAKAIGVAAKVVCKARVGGCKSAGGCTGKGGAKAAGSCSKGGAGCKSAKPAAKPAATKKTFSALALAKQLRAMASAKDGAKLLVETTGVTCKDPVRCVGKIKAAKTDAAAAALIERCVASCACKGVKTPRPATPECASCKASKPGAAKPQCKGCKGAKPGQGSGSKGSHSK